MSAEVARAASRGETAAMSLHPSRHIWHLLEHVHAVVYFDSAAHQAIAATGTKGFWMGYFGARAAPCGPVPAGIVEATFYNFAPTMIRRAVPDVWSFASPEALVEARAAGAAQALRNAVPSIEERATRIVALLAPVVRSMEVGGRVLAAANQTVDVPDDPVAALWQLSTALREHRGDGHVAALVSAGISGLEAHHLRLNAGTDTVASVSLRDVRGFGKDEWCAAADGLCARGLLNESGNRTPAGEERYADVERRTDECGWQPYAQGLTETGRQLLVSLLGPIAAELAHHLPFPNPIGLPEINPVGTKSTE